MGSGSQEVPLCLAPHSGTINWQCEEALYFSALHLSLSVGWSACLCMLVQSIPGRLERGVLGTHHIQDKELFKGQAGSGVLPSVLINFQTLSCPYVKDRNIDPHLATDPSLIICNPMGQCGKVFISALGNIFWIIQQSANCFVSFSGSLFYPFQDETESPALFSRNALTTLIFTLGSCPVHGRGLGLRGSLKGASVVVMRSKRCYSPFPAQIYPDSPGSNLQPSCHKPASLTFRPPPLPNVYTAQYLCFNITYIYI